MDIGVNPSKPPWDLRAKEWRGVLRIFCCETSGKTLDRILATGVGSAEHINRASGPCRGTLLEPPPCVPCAPPGVPGQKFTGVARPACELIGVGETLSAARLEVGLRSGAQQEDMRWRVLVPLCGVQTDPFDEGVEFCSPDGRGQKLVGI